ncbi:hypothetical protein [Rhodoferax sp.]|uniref:hypothetical protein n=1 Tax=Rhodoferax sp. TaxID=50421 RepID=UPI0025E47B75|nr:hypothetical protein [Rhodoferax sp.]
MYPKSVCAVLFAVAFSASANDIFNQRPAMGGGSSSHVEQTQTQVNTGQHGCAALAQERRAIEYIDQKQIWVPIEQQNANYHRMRTLKAEMSARRCSY